MGETGRVLIDSLHKLWLGFVDNLPNLAAGLIVLLAFIFGAKFTGSLVMRGSRHARMHGNLPLLLGRLTTMILNVFGFFVAAVIVFPGFKAGDLVAGLGITSVALGFAFKDVLQNFLAGILILWRQPFKVGDEIRSGIQEGTVEAINSRSTWIKTYDGERAVIPNADIYMQTVLVRTAYTKRRVRFVVGIGYGDSIEIAKAEIHKELDAEEGVLDDPGPWVYVYELGPSSVNLAVYYWVESRQANLLKVQDAVATRVKHALDRVGIDMPYPHIVVVADQPTVPN